MDAAELQRWATCGVLASARCLPLFWLTPSLAFGVTPGLIGVALALGLGLALTPLYLAGLPLSAAEVSGSALALVVSVELVRGAIIALGLALPALALRLSGAITQGLFSSEPAANSSRLGRLIGLAALVVAASAGGLLGALRLLLRDPPLLPARLDLVSLRAALMPLSELVLEAFALGVSLSGTVLLGSLIGALILGLLGRLSASPRSLSLGSTLWPAFGLSLLCLVAPRWLDTVPDLLRGFAQGTARILSGLP